MSVPPSTSPWLSLAWSEREAVIHRRLSAQGFSTETDESAWCALETSPLIGDGGYVLRALFTDKGHRFQLEWRPGEALQELEGARRQVFFRDLWLRLQARVGLDLNASACDESPVALLLTASSRCDDAELFGWLWRWRQALHWLDALHGRLVEARAQGIRADRALMSTDDLIPLVSWPGGALLGEEHFLGPSLPQVRWSRRLSGALRLGLARDAEGGRSMVLVCAQASPIEPEFLARVLTRRFGQCPQPATLDAWEIEDAVVAGALPDLSSAEGLWVLSAGAEVPGQHSATLEALTVFLERLLSMDPSRLREGLGQPVSRRPHGVGSSAR